MSKTTYWIIGIAVVLVIIGIIIYRNRKNSTSSNNSSGQMFGAGVVPNFTARNSNQNWVAIKDPSIVSKQSTTIYGCHNGIRYIYNPNSPTLWVKTNQPCQKTDKIF